MKHNQGVLGEPAAQGIPHQALPSPEEFIALLEELQKQGIQPDQLPGDLKVWPPCTPFQAPWILPASWQTHTFSGAAYGGC